MFIGLDTDKDGQLSQAELEKGMSEILTFFNIDEEELREMVEAIDTNKDGFIDYQEFVTAAYNRQEALCEKNLKAAFDLFDSDGNGQISIEELKEIFGRGQASDKDEKIWQEIMESADQDNDNQISYSEFAQTMGEVLRLRATKIELLQE